MLHEEFSLVRTVKPEERIAAQRNTRPPAVKAGRNKQGSPEQDSPSLMMNGHIRRTYHPSAQRPHLQPVHHPLIPISSTNFPGTPA